MANIFVKGEKVAAVALALLRREIRTPALFSHRLGLTDFKGSAGDVVNIKRPAVLRARDKGWRNDNAITVDQLMQTSIQVQLDQHPYSAVHLQPEEATLDVEDYARDVQAPQVRAMLEWFEESIVNTLGTATFVHSVDFDESSSDDPRQVALQARKLLNDAYVPASDRYWIVGSSVSAAIAGFDSLLEVDTSGLPEALRDGVVGRLAGFTIVEVPALNEDESYFVHASAVALATAAPVVPQGAARGGGVAAGNGLAVTQVWDYDGSTLKDRSVVHAFTGSAVVEDPKIGPDGKIVIDSGTSEPVMEFVRGVNVVFTPADGIAAARIWTMEVTGGPTGGTYLLTVDGEDTDPIAYNAANGTIETRLNDLVGVSAVVAGSGGEKTITFSRPVELEADGALLTGGTTPDVDVARA